MKSQNYTEEEVIQLRKLYEELGNSSLPFIAEELDKSVNSVRAKLVREKLYIAPQKPSRTKKNGFSKKEIIRELEDLGLPSEGLNGLLGATKLSLTYVKDFIVGLKNEK